MPGTSPDPAAPTPISRVHPVPTSRAGERLDRFLTEVERSLSRSAVQQLIDQGCVRVNGALARASRRVKVGDSIEVIRPRRVPTRLVAEDIPLTVVHEDEALAVIAKPPGMVVHPAVGHRTGTLVHALLHRYDALPSAAGLERAGIVHRIDKGTSGLLLIARTDLAHRELARQMEAREIKRVYRALVWGHLRQKEGRIEAPLGRSARDRKKFTVVTRGGRFAATRYRVERSYTYVSELSLTLETGRTHQIRVHLAHLGHPVFADPEYGGRRGPLLRLPPAQRAQAALLLSEMDHQALHAERLTFRHPVSGALMEFTAPLPPDFEAVLESLRCES
ncbi:MAG TPA: RluA family pseudouridine synthase [Candidatus Polarisedimenticolia bacterium]|nr:RluA family pseudouridine synthase [Candidatus Polarisedimenticolia bacterium]